MASEKIKYMQTGNAIFRNTLVFSFFKYVERKSSFAFFNSESTFSCDSILSKPMVVT